MKTVITQGCTITLRPPYSSPNAYSQTKSNPVLNKAGRKARNAAEPFQKRSVLRPNKSDLYRIIVTVFVRDTPFGVEVLLKRRINWKKNRKSKISSVVGSNVSIVLSQYSSVHYVDTHLGNRTLFSYQDLVVSKEFLAPNNKNKTYSNIPLRSKHGGENGTPCRHLYLLVRQSIKP